MVWALGVFLPLDLAMALAQGMTWSDEFQCNYKHFNVMEQAMNIARQTMHDTQVAHCMVWALWTMQQAVQCKTNNA